MSLICDTNAIRAILPHRSPFLFVDRVTAFDGAVTLTAEVDINPDWPHFRGHFPNQPIMPGVLVTEALAQASGLLLALTAKARNESTPKGLGVLAQTAIKYLSPARPGDCLVLHTTLIKSLGPMAMFTVAATVADHTIANGKLSLAVLLKEER